MKKLLIFFVVFNTHCLSAQDLNKATLSYFTDAFYQYDPALIAREKIMQIEKHEYRYAEDTVISHTVTERHLFDTLGMPTYIHTQYPGRDKSEIYYTYDSLNRLHTKEHYGISPELHYTKIESYVLDYEEDKLIRQRRFLLLNRMPVENGSSGFPERMFLYQNDSIAYLDTAVIVVSNNKDNCKDVATMIYPPSFKSEIKTTLKFHPNNKLAYKKVARNTVVQNYSYNTCGLLTTNAPSEKCLKFFPNKTDCLDQTEVNVCNQLDSTELDGEQVFFQKKEMSYFQHDSGPGTHITLLGYSYYDKDFRPILSVDSNSYKRGLWHLAEESITTTKIQTTSYTYYPNGMLHQLVSKNEHDELVSVVSYEITYYE